MWLTLRWGWAHLDEFREKMKWNLRWCWLTQVSHLCFLNFLCWGPSCSVWGCFTPTPAPPLLGGGLMRSRCGPDEAPVWCTALRGAVDPRGPSNHHRFCSDWFLTYRSMNHCFCVIKTQNVIYTTHLPSGDRQILNLNLKTLLKPW